MKKTIIFIAVAMLCLFFGDTICAQTTINAPIYGNEPIKVGERVPDLLFTNVINGDRKPLQLSALKGKAYILDFWGTWCGSCISGFPKMEKFQKKYSKNLEVLLVNDSNVDSAENILRFLEKRILDGAEIYLPVISERTFTQTLFPHRFYPHVVWIGADRRLKAVTNARAVTDENISRLIAGLDIVLPMKEL
ncbi:TlpA family protein disulfide reductase [Pedobacter agri]|uniref:TlpA family protein disulfide reductase n=1 Tax=Pedobacter agri TaxID=454586 RepID=UPI00293105E5|nr:TlpA disulfide reductase family protein [Pedobacter agri]